MIDWNTMDSVPKSTSTPTPHGAHVQAVYILGFMPDEALEPEACVEVIWWEPHEKNGLGCWVSNIDEDIRPTMWARIPALPKEILK